MYELGDQPLTNAQLLEAAKLSACGAVIAPDWMNDRSRTIVASLELLKLRPHGVRWSVGGVVQGEDYSERRKCFLEMQSNRMSPICFPFRTPREETIVLLAGERHLKATGWYHLLGLQHLSELLWEPPGVWSVDTGKVFKGYDLQSTNEIRGHGKIKLHDILSITHRRIAGYNIAYMYKLTSAVEAKRLSHLRERWRQKENR
jgi:hypothetical protein